MSLFLTEVNMKSFTITKSSAVKSLKRKHPWVFSGALEGLQGEPGELIRMVDAADEFLAIGYFNPGSSIRVRIFSFKDIEIDQDFWNQRILSAFELRKNVLDFDKTNSFRLINGEGDYIPGLIVDVYGEHAVIDYHVKSLERFSKEISVALSSLGFKPVTYESSPGKIEILENGMKFQASPGTGQKTGFFLDQRENRKRLEKYCKGKSVLNVFSYTGGFSIYALKAGAETVVNVDSSEFAIEQAKENYKLNGLEVSDSDFIVLDAFKCLEQLIIKGQKFDIVILDPPAFVKKREAVKRALGGYRRINYLAMKLLSEGGILSTYSCSGHISNDQFRTVVWQAANDAQAAVQIIENPRNQFDHPVDINCPESEYLKGLFLKIS